jgi:tetratricopeptide (TPR) repeat protein
MFCQICGARNAIDQEYCHRCHQKLLVISGYYTLQDEEAFDSNPEEQFSFDEHLLERISILEEVVRRLTGSMRQSLGTLYKLEQKILVNQTGITTLRDLLENKEVLGREEWSELWESRMDYHLLALEKRERFSGVKDAIADLYRGDARGDFQRHLDDAEMALLVFDMGAAARQLEAAHELDSKNHELAFFLAELFFNEGEQEKALVYFRRVLAVKPDHFESLVYGGVLCHDQGQNQRAEELLKRAVALEPENFLPSFSLGAVYASQGRLAAAALFLERAVVAEPVPQAHYLLGNCCYEMGKVTVAIRHLREAVRLDPAYEEAHDLLGLAYLDRRWVRKSLATLDQAWRLRPVQLDHRELRQLLGSDELEPAAGDGAGGWLRRAADALAAGRPREALSCYRRLLSEDPENPALLVAYAITCLDLGRTREIEAVVGRVLGLDPGERLRTSACATLIEALRLEGKYREGNRVGRSLLDDSDSDFAKTVAYFELAFNLAEMDEDLDQALSFANRSVELAPEELRHLPLAALGWVHYKRREFDQSIEMLTRSTALGSSPRSLTQLGMALLAAGKREQARRVLGQARESRGPRTLPGGVLETLQGPVRRWQEPPLESGR